MARGCVGDRDFSATILGAPRETRSAVAKECHGQTPLPADVRLIAPGTEVPEAIAGLPGRGVGRGWTKRDVRRCATRWSSKRYSEWL